MGEESGCLPRSFSVTEITTYSMVLRDRLRAGKLPTGTRSLTFVLLHIEVLISQSKAPFNHTISTALAVSAGYDLERSEVKNVLVL